MPDLIITPNRGYLTGIPTINFIGASGSGILLQILQDGSLAFIGNQGGLFSIQDSLTGSLMSVNNIAGLPILEVFDTDKVVLGEFGTNAFVVSGSGTAFGTDYIYPNKVLFISGDTRYEGHIFSGDVNIADIFYLKNNPSGYATTQYTNGIGINLSGRLTQTGATLFARDSSISGSLQTQINSLPTHSEVVHKTGEESINGVKKFTTFSNSSPIVEFTGNSPNHLAFSVTGSSFYGIKFNPGAFSMFSNNGSTVFAQNLFNCVSNSSESSRVDLQNKFLRTGSLTTLNWGTKSLSEDWSSEDKFTFNGGHYDRNKKISANYSILKNDNRIYLNNTSLITLTFGNATTFSGQLIKLKQINTGITVLTGTHGQFFDGSPSYVLNGQYNAYEIHSDGSNWYLW